MVSGAGPAKENTSKKFVLTLGFTGDGGLIGNGVAVVGVIGVEGVAAVSGLLCSGSAMHLVVGLDRRELCTKRLPLGTKEILEMLLTRTEDIAALVDAAIVIAPTVNAISNTKG
jgi:hypothetical protein